MQRKRDGLVTIGNIFTNLDEGPVKAFRDAPH